MAVSVLNAWTGNSDSVPNGVMTISAGTGSRLAVLAYSAEHDGQLATSQDEIGGVAATAQHLQFWENGSNDQHAYFHWWKESAISSFADNDIDWAFGADTPNKHNWSFAVYDGVNQTNPVTAGGGNADTNVLNIATTSTADDYDLVLVSRSSANRDLTNWGALGSPEWTDADDSYWTGLAHAAGGTTPITLTGDGIVDDITYAHLIINAATAGITPQAMYHLRNHGNW